MVGSMVERIKVNFALTEENILSVNNKSGKMALLEDISKKLEIDDKKIINKASEHLRLLGVKSGSLQISEYAKNVICLDLAATNSDGAFNQEMALSLLNIGKAKYRKDKQIIQRILNVTQVPDVKSICSTIRVTKSKELEENATRMLKVYRDTNDAIESHPQYDAMAVYHTSKMMKIKVNEEKLIEVSHLRRMQWTNLKTKWNRWLEESKFSLDANPKKKTGVDDVLQEVNGAAKENVMPKDECMDVTESYEDWKKRILAKAYADLKSNS